MLDPTLYPPGRFLSLMKIFRRHFLSLVNKEKGTKPCLLSRSAKYRSLDFSHSLSLYLFGQSIVKERKFESEKNARSVRTRVIGEDRFHRSFAGSCLLLLLLDYKLFFNQPD